MQWCLKSTYKFNGLLKTKDVTSSESFWNGGRYYKIYAVRIDIDFRGFLTLHGENGHCTIEKGRYAGLTRIEGMQGI